MLTKGAGTNDFNLFLPLAKVEKTADGGCIVSGYASTPSLDLDGEIVSLDAVKKALPGYWEWRNIREMHTASAVGVAQEANVDGTGLFLTAKITDKTAVQKCLDEVYKGYSIGGKKLAKTGNEITEIELIEVSLVDRPANPDCRISVAKRAKDNPEAYLIKAPRVSRTPQARALLKMAQAVETLAKADNPQPGLPAGRDGFSLPAPTKCAMHGVLDCKKCMKAARKAKKGAGAGEVEKREVSTGERKSLAREGKALPGGGFPIKDKKDLSNARQAVGRAKNPGAARALIRRRAKDLGVTLPETWSKKEARALIAKAEGDQRAAKAALGLEMSLALPSFLSLSKSGAKDAHGVKGFASAGAELADSASGNDGPLDGFLDLKVKKGMGTAGSLAYVFDSLRSAQRSLLMEAKREGGDKKDAKLAATLGTCAQQVADVISEKARHEGQEALDLSDADDKGLGSLLNEDFAMNAKGENSLDSALMDVLKRAAQPTRAQRMNMARGNLKKASQARKAARSAVEDAHKMLKAVYIAKAAKGKKPPVDDGDDDDMTKSAAAMAKLQKAYGELEKVGTFQKAAREQLAKLSRSGQRGQEAGDSEGGFYEVPMGVKDLSPDAMSGARPGTAGSTGVPPAYPDAGGVYPGKAAKFAKGGMVTVEVADLMAENARLQAQHDLLSKIPANAGRGRPNGFDMNKLNGGQGGGQGFASGGDPVGEAIRASGIDPMALASDDENVRKAAAANVAGQYLLGSSGKSILDSSFHGAAGGRS